MRPPLQCRVTARRIRVLVVDMHPHVRHVVAVLVGAFYDMELAGEAASGEEALGLCGRSCPDVVLMGLTMPGLSAPETTRAILGHCPAARIVGMSAFQEEEQASEMLRAGAVRCVIKNISADELASAIRGTDAV